MASTAAFPRFSPMTSPSATPAKSARPRRSVAISAHDALALWRKKKAVFIDLRDWEIVDRSGWIEGSMHCPPGEFSNIVSPSSPLHTRLFEPGKTFIFYGGPETSPLASAKRAREIGLDGALALRGGLTAWRNAGGRLAGHPNSPFPALKSSFFIAARYTRSRIRAWWRKQPRRGATKLKKA